MLTGQRAFAEDDISETLAAVLKSEPDWTRLPSDVPPAIRTLIQRCLVKDRRQRVADISAAKFVLCELGNLGTRPATANVAAAPRSRWQRVLPPLAAAAVTAAIVGAGMWMLRPVPRAPLAAQFTFGVPPGEGLTATGRQLVAISADGARIAYAANSRLYLRPIGDLVARPIPGTEGPTVGPVNPLFSPDGQSIAFFSVGDPSSNDAETRAYQRRHGLTAYHSVVFHSARVGMLTAFWSVRAPAESYAFQRAAALQRSSRAWLPTSAHMVLKYCRAATPCSSRSGKMSLKTAGTRPRSSRTPSETAPGAS